MGGLASPPRVATPEKKKDMQEIKDSIHRLMAVLEGEKGSGRLAQRRVSTISTQTDPVKVESKMNLAKVLIGGAIGGALATGVFIGLKKILKI